MGKPASIERPKAPAQRKLSSIKARIGEKSNPATGGKNDLKGLQILSDICIRRLKAGCGLPRATQLITMPATKPHQTIVNTISRTENRDQEIMMPKLNKIASSKEIR